jgi:c-di-GMP-binding flagellar brake protein YcgR
MMRPAVNQLVAVVSSERRLATRVEDTPGEATVMIAPPSSQGVAYPLVLGEEVSLEWPTARGLVRGLCVVAGRRWEDDVPLVELTLLESAVLQRREFVRAQAIVSGELLRDGAEPIAFTSLDLSGSGMQLVVADCDLELGEVVTVALWLPDMGEIEANATVVRSSETGDYGLRFLDIDPAARERLIRFVFAEHRLEFATLRRRTG